MRNLKFINSGAWLLAVVLLFVPLLSTQQQVFAGAPPAQGGLGFCDTKPNDDVLLGRCCSQETPPSYCSSSPRQQKDFAAAMMKYEQNQTPGAGGSGGDSEMRSNLSFFAAVLVLFGGIWALLALSLHRFGKRIALQSVHLSPIYRFAFQPSTALTAIGLLFGAAIVGGILIAPEKTAAGKPGKPGKSKMTSVSNPSNKPVFKAAQVVGGSGITQIGAPVFDSAGNRYVSGGFTGTFTVGATTLTATRDFDAFIAKYDANGNGLWARRGSGLTTGVTNIPIEGVTALAVDANGNVYAGGSFVKTLTLQGGANANITLNDDGVTGFN